MALIWNTITDAITMASSTRSSGRVVNLVVELLEDGRSEWTVQYGSHHQRSGISPSSDAAYAAAEAAVADLENSDPHAVSLCG